MTLHEALIHIRDHGPTYPWFGICANADRLGALDATSRICYLAEDWPKSSGSAAYPVLGWSDYQLGRLEDNQWDGSTENGKLRYELLDFLIEATKPTNQGDHHDTTE